MKKLKIELIFDDKQEKKILHVYPCEFEQLLHNKEITSDGNMYVITQTMAVNEGSDFWYSLYCYLKGGLRSRGTVLQTDK